MAQCSTRSLKTGRNGQPLLRSETLVGANRPVGEKKRSPFAVSDHDLNGIEKVFCGPIGIAEFTCGPAQAISKDTATMYCSVSLMKIERSQVRPVPFDNPLNELVRSRPS